MFRARMGLARPVLSKFAGNVHCVIRERQKRWEYARGMARFSRMGSGEMRKNADMGDEKLVKRLIMCIA